MKTPAFLPILCAGATLLIAATAHAYDPYQSRLDREYQSYSNALTSAYKRVEPAYQAPAPYKFSSPSSPSYSSSSSSSSSSRYSNSYSFAKPEPPPRPLSAAERTKLDKEMKAAAEKKAAADKIKEAAMWDRIRAADARVAHETWLLQPVMLGWQWENLRKEFNGRAPLHAPTNDYMQDKSGEFLYYTIWSKEPGAQWENLRAGQMCLNREAPGAMPSDAFGYFAKANPDWVETQFGLGVCYLNGLGVQPDPQKARVWLEKAVDYKQPKGVQVSWGSVSIFNDYQYQACRELAYAYDYGRGLPADPALALRWYEKALFRPLFDADIKEVDALIVDFWRRNAAQSRALVEAEFARARPNEAARDLSGTDPKTLYEIGDFVDSKPRSDQDLLIGRGATPYFFEAAKQGYEPAARAYFSPAKNGYDLVDLKEGEFNRAFSGEQLDWVTANWPAWEAKWKAASEAGDAGANVPLAFYYSGVRGNKPDLEQARFYAEKLPADTPRNQRDTIRFSLIGFDNEWLKSMLRRFKATNDTFDVAVLPGAPDLVKAVALREAADALRNPAEARDGWLAAMELGDLVSAVRIYSQAKKNKAFLGSHYDGSLVRALEKQAQGGDKGAALVLGSLLKQDVETNWSVKVRESATAKATLTKLAAQPDSSETDYQAARAAAQSESDKFLAQARKWGLKEHWLIEEVTISPQGFADFDAAHHVFASLRERAQLLTAQLDSLEKSVGPRAFNVAADGNFGEGYKLWEKPQTDYVSALDAFTRSASLGHPVAPLAIAFYYANGTGGFPKDENLAKRWRALADARLEILAQNGDAWAQIFLGDLLINKGDNKPDYIFRWLPQDKVRGMKWLRTAALNGEVLPSDFGDSQGMPVSFQIAGIYYNWDRKDDYAKWSRIEKLYYAMSKDFTRDDQTRTPAQFAKFKADAQKVLASDLKYKED